MKFLFLLFLCIPAFASDTWYNLVLPNTISAPSNTAVPPQTAQFGGSDGTNLRPFNVDTSGHIQPATTVDKTTTGTMGALNATVALTLNGTSSALFVLSGTWVGTVIAEGTLDGFTTSSTLSMVQTTGAISNTGVSANGNYRILVTNGYTQVRLRMSAYTSGTASATMNASASPSHAYAWQLNPLNLNGQMAALDGQKTTYRSSAISIALAATTTDFFTITGSASKTIRVLYTDCAFTGGGLNYNFQLVKRSTANTGGTPTVSTVVPNDSTNAAGTATVLAYTANPTLGTLVGAVGSGKAVSPTATTAQSSLTNPFSFGNRPGQSVVLRGTGEVLAWNGNAVTGATNASCWAEWSEE